MNHKTVEVLLPVHNQLSRTSAQRRTEAHHKRVLTALCASASLRCICFERSHP